MFRRSGVTLPPGTEHVEGLGPPGFLRRLAPRVAPVAISLLAVAAAARLEGQTEVRMEGSGALPAPEYAVRSPMVLETSFPIETPAAWRRIKSLEGFSAGQPIPSSGSWPTTLGREISLPDWYALGRYTCDGVSLREEVTSQGQKWEEPGLRVQELRRVPSGFEITLEATLYNPRTNRDKLVTLSYEVLDSEDRVIATRSTVQKALANAKSGNNVDVVFLFSPDEMKRVARLRLTMTTRDY